MKVRCFTSCFLPCIAPHSWIGNRQAPFWEAAFTNVPLDNNGDFEPQIGWSVIQLLQPWCTCIDIGNRVEPLWRKVISSIIQLASVIRYELVYRYWFDHGFPESRSTSRCAASLRRFLVTSTVSVDDDVYCRFSSYINNSGLWSWMSSPCFQCTGRLACRGQGWRRFGCRIAGCSLIFLITRWKYQWRVRRCSYLWCRRRDATAPIAKSTSAITWSLALISHEYKIPHRLTALCRS